MRLKMKASLLNDKNFNLDAKKGNKYEQLDEIRVYKKLSF